MLDTATQVDSPLILRRDKCLNFDTMLLMCTLGVLGMKVLILDIGTSVAGAGAGAQDTTDAGA